MVFADSRSEEVGRVQNADAHAQADDEPANMRKVVQTGKEAEHKRNDDLDKNKEQLSARIASLVPRIKKIEQIDGNNTEQST